MPHWVQLTALLLVVLQFCAQVTRNRITVTNTYDQVGNKLSVQDGNLHTTTFAYDGLNRNTAVTDANGKSTALTYDALNKTQRTDALGQITTYLYDSRNRLTNVVYNSVVAANSQRNYAYDNVGNLLSVTEPAKTAANVAYTYDALNRAVSETSNGQTHTYLYDLAGNRLQTVYGGTSRTITSTYDALNRLSTMTETGRTTGYGYDLNGNITRKTAPNGDTEAYAFDALNRCSTESAQTVGASSLFNYAYGYDLVGNVLTVGETYPAGLNNRTVTNTYDAINRLLVEAVAASVNVTTTYAYDNANNRTSKAIVGGPNAGTTNYSSNSLNQLTGYGDNTGRTVTLGYDNNGNRTSRVVTAGTDNGTDSYTYDFENRLVGLVKGTGGTTGGAGTYAYQYDYRTRRIVRDESNAGGTITNLVFSGGTSVQEYDGATPSLTVEYIRGSDYGGGVGGILYTIRNGTPSYTHENKRGDVVAKTDGSGNLTYQAQYEAFGKQVATAGSTLDRQKSNSKDTDPTNLVDEGMRYRDLETGMFLNRDPAGFVDGPNLYTYVKQNPWSSFDAEGLVTLMLNGQEVPWTVGNQAKAFVQNCRTYAPQITTLLVGSAATIAAPEVAIPARIAYAGLSGAAAANAGNEVHNEQTGQPLGTNAPKVTLEGAAAGVGGQVAAEVIAPETAVAVNAQNKGSAAGATPGAQTTRVGRWMSQNEANQMTDTGTVQESTSGTTHVVAPPNAATYKGTAPVGSVHAEFDVPSTSVVPTSTGGVSKIIGPNTTEGKLAASKGQPVPQMPAATNIKITDTKTAPQTDQAPASH